MLNREEAWTWSSKGKNHPSYMYLHFKKWPVCLCWVVVLGRWSEKPRRSWRSISAQRWVLLCKVVVCRLLQQVWYIVTFFYSKRKSCEAIFLPMLFSICIEFITAKIISKRRYLTGTHPSKDKFKLPLLLGYVPIKYHIFNDVTSRKPVNV